MAENTEHQLILKQKFVASLDDYVKEISEFFKGWELEKGPSIAIFSKTINKGLEFYDITVTLNVTGTNLLVPSVRYVMDNPYMTMTYGEFPSELKKIEEIGNLWYKTFYNQKS